MINITHIYGFAKMILVTFILVSLSTNAVAKHDESVITPRLIVRDEANIQPKERFERLAQEADETLLNILRLWSAKPGINKHGKIRLIFDRPLPNDRTSIFYWSKDDGHRVRTVQVFGIDGRPRGMAHKMTHAVFPSSDKLIRNMMGIHSENLTGNVSSFPMCGFSNDIWVQVFLQTDSTIPLTSLGPEHREWGMEFRNNKPVIRDRSRQHTAYAEAGSFGEYLIKQYGITSVKKFYRLSLNKKRPWKEAFGLTLSDLEASWIANLMSEFDENSKDISILTRLRTANPETACDEARRSVSSSGN